MTVPPVVADILRREGGYRHVPGDRGGATNYGITQATLGSWRKLGRPATPEEVRALPVEEAEAIYAARYVAPFTWVPYAPLREQLIDFGVNSGVERATRWLQRVLGLAPTGDPRSALLQDSIRQLHPQLLGQREALAVVNDALVAARSYMIDIIEDAGGIPASDEEGVESRALGFFLAKPAP